MAVDGSTPLAPGRAATLVTGAIQDAAQATGTSFNYLLATAKIESNLDPTMTMQSSSATGLFQFIDQTWLGTLKQSGPAFGYGSYANAIERDPSGRWVVKDPQMRQEIMKLRTDPTANAMMAGVFTQQNAAILGKRIGRTPTDGELYIAHFFGPGGAGKLIGLAASSPQTTAADVFPQAARANRSIFYDRQGNARSVAGVYGELVRRYQVASNSLGAGSAGAVAGVSPPPTARQRQPTTGTVAVAAAAAAAAPAAAPASSGEASPPRPSFDSLFSDSQRRTGVAPVVAALWSDPGADVPATSTAVAYQPATKSAPRGAEQRPAVAASPLDLFRDLPSSARGLFGGSS